MNAIIEQLNDLKLYGMANFAVELLGDKNPLNLSSTLQQAMYK